MRDTLCDAITERQVVEFSYDGQPRRVEPHRVGRTTAGNDVLSGYQVGGRSNSGTVLDWRLFELRKIGSVVSLDGDAATALLP
jgi:predicted DNA-binding transcriptional regulator YafY